MPESQWLRYEQGIVKTVKDNPKAFSAYVNSKTKMKSGISDIKNENGEMRSSDVDKANILNNFFASVFTKEGDSVIKAIAPKTLDSLHEIKDTLSRGRHTLIILPFIYCDMIFDRNDPLPRVIRQTSGSFKIRIN